MCKKFLKELLLAAVLTAVLFVAFDFFGEALFPSNDITLSAGLMVFALAVLILPPLIGGIPSGYLVGKKIKKGKDALFVPAIGAAVGGLALMSLSLASMLLMTDVAWQSQLAEAAKYGGTFFADMTLQDFKSMVLFSVVLGAIFIAIMNFAIGLLGGLIGSKLALGKKRK